MSSDWHVLHRNIYWFLPQQRAALSGTAEPRRLSEDEFMDAERRTYRRILERVRQLVEDQPIRRFLFLGDLIFGMNRSGARKAAGTVARELPEVIEIFSFLRAKGIQRILLLGNHDDFKARDRQARALYDELFDETALFLREGPHLYTHFPVGYSRANDESLGTADEKYYRMNKVFYKLDKQLVTELGGERVTNFHGHIHAGPFPYPIENVRYQNVALDALAMAAP